MITDYILSRIYLLYFNVYTLAAKKDNIMYRPFMNILIQFTRLEQIRFYARLYLSMTILIIYCPIAYAYRIVYSLKAKNWFDRQINLR